MFSLQKNVGHCHPQLSSRLSFHYHSSNKESPLFVQYMTSSVSMLQQSGKKHFILGAERPGQGEVKTITLGKYRKRNIVMSDVTCFIKGPFFYSHRQIFIFHLQWSRLA